jgi:hypothetical protein
MAQQMLFTQILAFKEVVIIVVFIRKRREFEFAPKTMNGLTNGVLTKEQRRIIGVNLAVEIDAAQELFASIHRLHSHIGQVHRKLRWREAAFKLQLWDWCATLTAFGMRNDGSVSFRHDRHAKNGRAFPANGMAALTSQFQSIVFLDIVHTRNAFFGKVFAAVLSFADTGSSNTSGSQGSGVMNRRVQAVVVVIVAFIAIVAATIVVRVTFVVVALTLHG